MSNVFIHKHAWKLPTFTEKGTLTNMADDQPQTLCPIWLFELEAKTPLKRYHSMHSIYSMDDAENN